MILVRLDWDDNENPCDLLNRSASFCQTQSQWEYQNQSPSTTVCVVKFGGIEIVRTTGSTKAEARDDATRQAVDLMAQKCFTIRIRNRFCSNGTAVDLTDVESSSNEKSGIVKENVGHKLLKLMGWSGGGLGKDGSGIAEPITAASMNHGEGFGAQSASKHFKKRIEAIIEDFAKSNSPYDLVFTTGFTNDQRKEMHQIARRIGLKSKSLGKDADRFLTISKKFSCQDIVRELVAKGGQTDKYTLIPPPNPS
ncbi:hypothetical protein TCAL_01744 [Tigriopus californicus]|uniref:G-patch domain-containing protein n=2 Tax=Tigriopus californicus TaxID=6832 RepID=A0A553PM66_TIGCA|nr:hypothetical protein TCAL_01744 [Tigriopus californicus]